MTRKEIPTKCKNCIYLSSMGYGEYICEYILNTGEPRGCLIDNNCNKFKSKRKDKGGVKNEKESA